MSMLECGEQGRETAELQSDGVKPAEVDSDDSKCLSQRPVRWQEKLVNRRQVRQRGERLWRRSSRDCSSDEVRANVTDGSRGYSGRKGHDTAVRHRWLSRMLPFRGPHNHRCYLQWMLLVEEHLVQSLHPWTIKLGLSRGKAQRFPVCKWQTQKVGRFRLPRRSATFVIVFTVSGYRRSCAPACVRWGVG